MSRSHSSGRREVPRRKKKPGRLPLLLIPALILAAGAAVLVPRLHSSAPEETVSAVETALPDIEESTAAPTPEETTVPETEAAETAAPAETEAVAAETAAAASSRAEELLSSLTLREKVCQLFIVTQEQLTGVSQVIQTGDTSRQAIAETPVGGIIYFAQNIESRQQVNDMIAGIQSASGLGLFISVDEEGGKVARLGNNSAMGTTTFPDMAEIGSTGDTDQAYQVGYTIGSELRALGFNLDFAPVADVYSNPDNTVIGTRSFSSDPQVCADMVSACVRGFSDSGTLCTLKHFPGHGDTSADTHEGAAVSNKTLDELRQTELVPFAAGIEAGADFVMVSHISLPQVTGDNTPATLSPQIISILRDELGFDGLIITDSMSMGAITDFYSSGDAAVKALQAGVDIILMPEDLNEAIDTVIAAVENGTLSEARIDESVLRILQCKLDRYIIE